MTTPTTTSSFPSKPPHRRSGLSIKFPIAVTEQAAPAVDVAPQVKYARIESKEIISSSSLLTGTGPTTTTEEFPHDAISAARALLLSCSSRSLSRTFPLAIPVILLHQVFVIQRNSHAVTEEALHRARLDGTLRFFHAHCGASNVFITEETHYRGLVAKLLDAAEQTHADEEANTLRYFLNTILPTNHQMTCEIPNQTQSNILCRLGLTNRVIVTDGDISPPNTCFEFAIPMLGPFCTELQAGRKELIRLVKRGTGNRNEVLKSRLPRKLKSSSIHVEYHVHDLVGSGVLQQRDSGIGGPRSMLVYNP